MSMLHKLTRLFADPPPASVFELSEGGIAWATLGDGPPRMGFEPLDPDVVSVSPLHDNVLRPEALAARVKTLAPPNGARKRRPAALILPDYCARVTVLDFDSFPSEPTEQLSLVRFRVRKSVPFDVESAAVSYAVQPHKGKRLDVVVGVVALEIVARYEAPFRAAGFHPGFVTTSGLAMLDLVRGDGVNIVARLSGRALTVSVLQGGSLRLARCVELAAPSVEELTAVLYPTLAYIEDELAAPPGPLLLCGFGELPETARAEWQKELGVQIATLESRFGAPAQHNAGLLGYLQAVEAA